MLTELLSVTSSDDSLWMYVPSVVYPNDLRKTEIFSVIMLHDLKSVNKTDRSALLGKLNWKIVNQNPLGTISVK